MKTIDEILETFGVLGLNVENETGAVSLRDQLEQARKDGFAFAVEHSDKIRTYLERGEYPAELTK